MRIHNTIKKREIHQTLENYQKPELIYKARPLSILEKDWTSDTWKLLHLITFTYPNFPTYNKQEKMKLFLENLNLPCDVCEENYMKYIAKNPITSTVVKNRENLVNWLIDFRIHERAKLKLKEFTRESILYYYEQFDKTVIESKAKSCCSSSK